MRMNKRKFFKRTYSNFMKQVRNDLGLFSQGDAARVSRAVLETLDECICKSSSVAIRRQLPEDIAELFKLEKHDALDYSLEVFVEKVSRRALVENQQAFQYANIVLRVLCRFLEKRTANQLRQELGLSYAVFFSPIATDPFPPMEK